MEVAYRERAQAYTREGTDAVSVQGLIYAAEEQRHRRRIEQQAQVATSNAAFKRMCIRYVGMLVVIIGAVCALARFFTTSHAVAWLGVVGALLGVAVFVFFNK